METETVPRKVAEMLYRQLEYYRFLMPMLVDMTPEQYAGTREAANTDGALRAYKESTGQ